MSVLLSGTKSFSVSALNMYLTGMPSVLKMNTASVPGWLNSWLMVC